ncbi:carotenoid biosynthesis protein [Modestobacter sp. VKM Ac-2985]|uniref:carotenoid biosynthesis protein n=1 Tax=Modestobacter sp. VKM Ac-2985 TaxID=3004139 RepID=UPI0022AB8EA8|nr:carotenoid biosynthesis protein [Modestobacter sp. VKM Ac-2985]MCZ2837333.1 carotenoid biosynthesis protein [Modestobacter sp. VKM Ac-2985]
MTGTLTTRRPGTEPAPLPWLPLALTVALLGAAIAYPLSSGDGRDTVSWAIVLLGSAVSVSHAAVSRGVRTGAAVLVLVGVVAVLFEALGLRTGFPYGEYRYSDLLGPTLLGVPFLVPLAWLMMAWPSWVLAARLTSQIRPGRRRAARVAVAAYVFAAWDVVLDPQLVQAGYWRWTYPEPGLPGIPTVPLTNLVGWLLAGLVLMTLLDLLVERTSLPPRIGDAAPLLTLGWMVLGGALAHAAWLDLPGSAVWGVVLAVPVLAVLAVQERRRRR